MSQHNKALTQKQKIILYASAAGAAVLAALIAVIIVIHTVKNPPAIIFNSNDASYMSSANLSQFDTSSNIFIPDSLITVVPNGNDTDVNEVIEIVEQTTPTKQNTVIIKDSSVDTSHLTKRQIKLNVNYVPQNPELPTGCEITSLTTVLNYYGYNVSKTDMSDNYLDKTMDKMGDFWEVFVGNPRKNGFGCYAKPIVTAANRYLYEQDGKYTAINYSGAKFESLLTLVQDGTPVIIWGTMYGEKENNLRVPYATIKWNINGKDLQWLAPEHCMVLIGYDLDRSVAIMSDPQRGIVEYDLETVKARYLAMHSQCVILEEKPVINGIENGAIYYTTQYVTIDTRNLKSVTINGDESEPSFYIDGNSSAMYEIIVTDKNDNVITYVVYTKRIDSLIEPIQQFSSNTVTSDDINTINNVKNTLLDLSTKYSSTSEINAINDYVEFCDNFLNKISEIEKKIKRATQTYNIYKNKELDSSNQSSIISLKESLNELIASQNLTDSQRKELNSMLLQCNKWLAKLSPQTPPGDFIE